MIAKKVQMNSPRKSSFKNLVNYLTDTKGNLDRVGEITITNCNSLDPLWASLEVAAIQDKNKRAQSDKTYHLLISFPVGEQVDTKTLKEIEEKMCTGIGYGEHQRISVVHRDTENLHIHIAINKIHPQKLTLHEPYYDYKKRDQLCIELEKEYGLKQDNHGRTGKNANAQNMEANSGQQSLITWIQRNALSGIENAKTWDELHLALARCDLAIQPRGNGLVIQNQNDAAITVKASSISKSCSKMNLEQRLGAFEPSSFNAPVEQKYEKQPLKNSRESEELYSTYRNQRSANEEIRNKKWERQKGLKNEKIERAKKIANLQRKLLKTTKGPFLKKLLHQRINARLKNELEKIQASYSKNRQKIYANHKQSNWVDWLRDQSTQGNEDALKILRGRENKRTLEGNQLRGSRREKPLFTDIVSKKGMVTHNLKTTTAKDQGNALTLVSKSFNQDDVLAALKLAHDKWGKQITVTGSDEFKTMCVKAAVLLNVGIVFTDPALEGVRKQAQATQHSDAKKIIPAQAEFLAKKPTVKKAGKTPPPASQNRLRNLSQLPVMKIEGKIQTQTTQQSQLINHTKEQHNSSKRVNTPPIHSVGNQPPPASKNRLRELSELPVMKFAGTVDANANQTKQSKETDHDRDNQRRRHPQPNIGRVGKQPPPESKNRLRELSELGVVQLAGRSEVLLPSDVSRNMEQQAAQSDHELRRNIYRAGGITDQQFDAAQQYIKQRNCMRDKVLDILMHRLYNPKESGPVIFSGIREVEGNKLALLKSDQEIIVLPINQKVAARLKPLKIGTEITLLENGIVRTGSRSRGR